MTLRLPSLSFLAQAFWSACRRFPLVMVSAAFATFCVSRMIALRDDEGYLPQCWMMAQLGIPLFIGLGIFGEVAGWRKNFRFWVLQLAGVAALAVYCWQLPEPGDPGFDMVSMPRYLCVLAVAHLWVATAPFLNKQPVADFWEYNKQLFANFIVGATYALIIWVGISLAILAIDRLFELDFDSRIYAYWFVFMAGIFLTNFFLYHLPEDFVFEQEESVYNMAFKHLCTYIFIPIVGIYFLILYAYSLKILFSWDLPRGWVAILVIGFSVAGILTYLLNYQLPRLTDSVVSKFYHRWFWPVLLPMVVLLFVAIGKRIADYGVTEARFAVAHTGIWLLLCGLYFLWSRKDNIKFIPISLGLFALAAVWGPFSAFNVAERNQIGILNRLLTDNGLMKDGKVVQANGPIPDSVKQRITSCFDFLDRRDRLAAIQSWLPMPVQNFPQSDMAYTNSRRIAAWMGLAENAPPLDAPMLNLYHSNTFYPDIAIDGHTRYVAFELIDQTFEPYEKIILTKDATALVYRFNKSLQDTFSLQQPIGQWVDQQQSGAFDLRDRDEIQVQGRHFRGKLLLDNADLMKTRGAWRIHRMHGVLFLRAR